MMELLWRDDESPCHLFLNWGNTEPDDCFEQNLFVREQLYAQLMGLTE